MELLHICLERIEWQGNVSDWRSRLDQALDRVQSQLDSKTSTRPLLFTAFQIDCLTDLCSAAVTGDEAETLSRATLLCDAILPFGHWIAGGFQLGKNDPFAELALRYPKIHALMRSAARRIPYKASIQHNEAKGKTFWQD